MQNIFKAFLILTILLLPFTAKADTFEKEASYTVCFTPGQDCTEDIVSVINNAISEIWVQAYSFTSKPIAKALVTAKERGVRVQIILDKEALSDDKKIVNYLARYKIPIWVDNQPAIAHNKVIVADQTQVVTGSFNFTNAAQYQNAENVLIIYDEGLAKKYLTNWQNRQRVSKIYTRPVYSTADADEQTNWLALFWQWLVNLFNQLFHSK